MEKTTKLGTFFYAIALMASGIQQLITRDFVRLVPWPAWLPWRPFWACLTGLLLVLTGAALVAGRKVRPAALTAGALLLLLFLGLYLPQALSNPLVGFMWTNPGKTLALLGGAIILTGPGRGGRVATLFLGVFLLICGMQHFDYAAFVDTLVPGWIPPSQRFWTCFSGTALIAAGAGLLLPKTTRLAALLSALMVFLWVLLLHIPRTVALKSTFELDGVFEALAITGVALLVAGMHPAKASRPEQRAGGSV